VAGLNPARTVVPVSFGSPLDEARSPAKVASGLTACTNLTYRRFGSWGKRPGNQLSYTSSGVVGAVPTSGFRWYAAFPNQFTQLVIAADNNLWIGGDPGVPIGTRPVGGGSGSTVTSTLTPALSVGVLTQNATIPVTFAPTRDPAINAGSGGDILVMTGFSGPYGFAVNYINFSGTPVAGQTFYVSLVNAPTTIVTATYTTLPTDNAESVAQAVVDAINASPAVTAGAPFMAAAFVLSSTDTSAEIALGALNSGTSGNSITFQITLGGTAPGLTAIPTSPLFLFDGGVTTLAPLKYDGTTVSGLSPFIRITDASGNATAAQFTGCVAWHDHVWFWGDPRQPDSLYASDIDQPEGFVFMNQNGPYEIGAGDGDPGIQTCIPIGNILYVIKTNSIYAITGYDFQGGEYQFQVQPALVGEGVPAPQCITVLNNALVYWDGSAFKRLAVSSFESEDIGAPLALTAGKVSLGNQAVIRAVAGSFNVQTLENDMYTSVGPSGRRLSTNTAFFAVDTGSGVVDTVLMYDDDATQNNLGAYAWAPWTNMAVGAWIPFGSGPNSAGTGDDSPALFWIPNAGQLVVQQYGADPTSDNGGAYPFMAQTGWIDFGTPALTKDLERLLLDVEAVLGATIAVEILFSGPVNGTAQTLYPPQTLTFPTTLGIAGEESAQSLLLAISSAQRGFKVLFRFTESSPTSSYELNSVTAGFMLNTLADSLSW